MKSLLSLFVALLNDVKRLHPEVRGLDRDYVTIEARIKHEGASFVTSALPTLCKAFDQGLADGKMGRAVGYSYCGSIPRFLGGMFSLVFDPRTGLLRDDADIGAVKSIRQLLLVFKKLLPPPDVEKVLDLETQKRFCDVDNSIGQLPANLTSFLRHVSQYVLPGLDSFQDLKGTHGPGAVVEGFTPNRKWLEVYRGLTDFDHRLMEIGYDLPAMLMCSTPSPALNNDSSSTCARLVSVPKSYTKLRTITVEPCLNQFVQQAYGEHLRSNIRGCPILGSSLALTDQSRNQSLALEGSRTGDWCTIDLSDASDLLSNELVALVFGRFPRFLRGISECRTPNVQTSFGRVTLKKYAGMGNATTFPIQSVVFALLAICGSVSQTKLPGYGSVLSAARNVRVYGDDIIVRREHFPLVSWWLTQFGLKINQAKTFSEGNFRESCGWDCFRGELVHPVYLNYQPVLTSKEPNAYASVVSKSNQLWSECYYLTSELLRAQVDKGFPLPLVHVRSQALGWHTRQNVVSGQRWSRTLHRFEVKSYVVQPLRRKDNLDGEPALLKFYHRPITDGIVDKEHLESSSHKFRTRLVKRWVQAG